MLVKLPMWLTTLPNDSGRSHATVNAAIAPELLPEMARPAGSEVRLSPFVASGSSSSRRKRAFASPSESYSKLRFARGLPPGDRGWNHTRVDPHGNGDRHFLFRDEVVEYRRHPPRAVGFQESAAVKENHEAGRLGRVVLLWHIDEIIARGAGKNFAGRERRLADLAMRDVLRHRIGAKLVVVGAVDQGGPAQNGEREESGEDSHAR
jgi:hypothetical protein